LAEPLLSDLINEDPELEKLVRLFVESLPEMIAELGTLHDKEDWPALKDKVHDLKGLGGGYGYPQISEVAMSMENDLRGKTYNQIRARLDSLEQLLHRIELGLG
jgi:HPt (histidine-containing phosphotransfer) domain-containing protein